MWVLSFGKKYYIFEQWQNICHFLLVIKKNIYKQVLTEKIIPHSSSRVKVIEDAEDTVCLCTKLNQPLFGATNKLFFLCQFPFPG